MKTVDLNKLISRALREDAAHKDVTTNALIPADHISKGIIIIKENAIVCGLDIVKKVFQKRDRRVRFQTMYKDGTRVKRNTIIAQIEGRTRALLTGERVALNFLGYLSGIATDTRRFVEKIRRTKTKILDTRKTTPGLRLLEKYAVKCGGGHNHRPDLNELVLIKDNHKSAFRSNLSIPESIKRARRKTGKIIEIEVDTLAQFKEALTADPEMILLDNMSCAQMKKAVAIARKIPKKRRPILEASGGITLQNVVEIARLGVDCISIGSLTHSNNAVDVSMELIN